MIHNIMTLSIMTHSIMTHNIMTLSIISLSVTLSINDTQFINTVSSAFLLVVVMLKVIILSVVGLALRPLPGDRTTCWHVSMMILVS
jgi:hypothetical protein